MHLIIEFLPFVFGVLLVRLFYFTKDFILKNFLFILLNVSSGLLVNWWSKEGIGLAIVDIVFTYATFLGLICLNKFFTRGARHLFIRKM